MAQASNNVREAAAFARRMACRALVVVGGAVAGTALAWVLSSTSASAESVDARGPEVPVVTELVTPVSDALGEVADRLPHSPPPSHDPLKELGDRVKEAADHFGERAVEGFEQLPTCDMSGCDLGLEEIGTIGRGDAPGSYLPGDGFGRSDLPQTLPAVAPVAGTDLGVTPDFLAEPTATGRAHADGMNRRGSPAPELPSVPSPAFPVLPVPLAPAAPTTPAPGGQGHSGNHVDGALSAALPWHDGFTALTAGQTLPATEVISFGRAGAQPGVTPD